MSLAFCICLCSVHICYLYTFYDNLIIVYCYINIERARNIKAIAEWLYAILLKVSERLTGLMDIP